MKLIELGKDKGHVTTRQLTGDPLTQGERELVGGYEATFFEIT